MVGKFPWLYILWFPYSQTRNFIGIRKLSLQRKGGVFFDCANVSCPQKRPNDDTKVHFWLEGLFHYPFSNGGVASFFPFLSLDFAFSNFS